MFPRGGRGSKGRLCRQWRQTEAESKCREGRHRAGPEKSHGSHSTAGFPQGHQSRDLSRGRDLVRGFTASRFFVVILQKEAISLGRGGSMVSCSPGWPYVAEDVLNSTRTSHHHLLNAGITSVQEPSLFSLLLTFTNNELYGVKHLGVSPLPSLVAGRDLRHTFYKQKLEGTYFLPSLFFPYQSLFLAGLHACSQTTSSSPCKAGRLTGQRAGNREGIPQPPTRVYLRTHTAMSPHPIPAH